MQTHFVLKCPRCGSPAADCVAICPYCGQHTGFAALGLSKGVSKTAGGGYEIRDGAHVQLGGGERECPFCGSDCRAEDVYCKYCNAKVVIQRMRIATLVLDGGSLTIGHGGQLEIVGRSHRAIHKAARSGDIEALQHEVWDGDDPDFQDENGRRPLHFAAMGGHLEAAQWLVSVGANADPSDDGGKRAIEYARDNGHEAVVRLLQQLGARV